MTKRTVQKPFKKHPPFLSPKGVGVKLIPDFRGTILVMLMGVMMTAGQTAVAQTSPQPAPNYNISHADHLPGGYVELITNYAAVNTKMRQDIAAGQAAPWRTWLDPGLNNNDSLYWWMLADWLYQQKHYDQSYIIAVQAYVLTRMDLSVCSNEKNSQSTLQRLMTYHQHIIDLKPSQPIIRQAVLNSIARAENMVRDQKVANGMSCYISKVEAIKPGARKGIVIENLNATGKGQKKLLETQRKTIEEIKTEFSYNKIWINAQANDVWKSQVK